MSSPEPHERVRLRVRELGYRVQDIVTRTGEVGTGGPISHSAYHKLVKTTEALASARPATHLKLDYALQWEPGSIDAILNSGEPTELANDQAPAADIEDLTQVIAELVERQALTDATNARLASVLESLSAAVQSLQEELQQVRQGRQ